MAFYTGSANSFTDLLSALVSACSAEGWAWSDGILSKGPAYVRPYISTATTATDGPGLVIQGGTGKSGATLLEASAARPRLGLPGGPGAVPDIAWPVAYDILIHEAPDEVFCIVRSGIDRFYWLAFGVSDIPGIGGSGLWIAATSYRAYTTSPASFSIRPDSGSVWYNAIGETCPGFLWTTGGNVASGYISDTIHTGISSAGWSGRAATIGGIDTLHAVAAAAPHILRTPSSWNQDSPLIPIQGYLWRAASKCSMVVDVRHARYMRINNYEPGEIITLGPDRWIVYPFHRKNSAVADGGIVINHSGTFGWAIRYDGP